MGEDAREHENGDYDIIKVGLAGLKTVRSRPPLLTDPHRALGAVVARAQQLQALSSRRFS